MKLIQYRPCVSTCWLMLIAGHVVQGQSALLPPVQVISSSTPAFVASPSALPTLLAPPGSSGISLSPVATDALSVPQPSSQAPTVCDPRKSVLDPLTHRFRSDCGAQMWCDPGRSSNAPAPPFQSASVAKRFADEPESIEIANADREQVDIPPPLLLAREMLLPSNKTAKQTSTLVIFENSRSVLLYDRGEANPSSSSSTVALPSKSASGTTSLLPSAVVSTAGRGGNPATGTCRPKGCRKDEFPFGYKGIPTELLPPLCGPGSYCPDEESACQSLIPIGGDCELNRDDSCSPPSGGLSSAPAVKRQHGLFLPGVSSSSTVKAICLAGRCTLASVQLGQGCVLDHTQYLGYDMNGKEVGETVSRDDCHEGLYCDSTSSTCMAEKPYGEGCGSDRECTEYNCNSRHLCDLPPEAPHRLPSWAFGLVGLGIFAFLAMTVTLLYRTHTAHRVARADEIDRYFSEQWTYRQSILAMHAAFVASGVAASELLTGSNLLSADQGGHSAAAGHDGTLNESKGEQKGRAQDQTRVNNVASAAIPSRRMFAEDEDDARDATSQTPQAVIRRKPAPAV